MSSDEQARRLIVYDRTIFPIWMPICERWRKTHDDPKAENELALLHRIDAEIRKSGIMIDRGIATVPKSQADRARYADQYVRTWD